MKHNIELSKIPQLSEISAEELQNISGGNPWFIAPVLGVLGYMAKKVGDHWQCFKDGLMGRAHNTSHCGK